MKILIVEDDKFFREFYSVKLRENNFEVDAAEDGEIGLEKVTNFKMVLMYCRDSLLIQKPVLSLCSFSQHSVRKRISRKQLI